jgi:hypothetical protein
MDCTLMALRDHKTNEDIQDLPTTAKAFHQLSDKSRDPTFTSVDVSETNER